MRNGMLGRLVLRWKDQGKEQINCGLIHDNSDNDVFFIAWNVIALTL